MADDLNTLYGAYQANPTPESLHSVVKALEPTIGYSLASVNASNDPVVRAKASLYAGEAIKKFNPADPDAASLPTFVASHLRQLSRTSRASRSPVSIPERIQLDAYKLDQAKKKFTDRTGREPDMVELADEVKLPIKRIEKIHRYQFSVPSEVSLGGDINEEGPDFDKDAVEYVYHDADYTDRKILEMKTGFGGNPTMIPRDIAIKLNLTPTQLSRRSMRLTDRINKIRDGLTKI